MDLFSDAAIRIALEHAYYGTGVFVASVEDLPVTVVGPVLLGRPEGGK